MTLPLLFSAFIAGVLTFLAPCTLPVVPGFLGFISGVSLREFDGRKLPRAARRRIVVNAIFYVIGFSLVFILLGMTFALGASFLAHYRIWLARLGGLFVMYFGLSMMGLFRLPAFLLTERHPLGSVLRPGRTWSSFILGVSLGFSWTPCIGPILGTILLLASTSATAVQGGLLLLVYSMGLALPFLGAAWGLARLRPGVRRDFGGRGRLEKYARGIEMASGGLLLFLGFLLLAGRLSVLVTLGYRWLGFLGYERLMDYM